MKECLRGLNQRAIKQIFPEMNHEKFISTQFMRFLQNTVFQLLVNQDRDETFNESLLPSAMSI